MARKTGKIEMELTLKKLAEIGLPRGMRFVKKLCHLKPLGFRFSQPRVAEALGKKSDRVFRNWGPTPPINKRDTGRRVLDRKFRKWLIAEGVPDNEGLGIVRQWLFYDVPYPGATQPPPEAQERGSPPPPENEETPKTSPAPTEKAQESSSVSFTLPEWNLPSDDPQVVAVSRAFDDLKIDAEAFIGDVDRSMVTLQSKEQMLGFDEEGCLEEGFFEGEYPALYSAVEYLDKVDQSAKLATQKLVQLRASVAKYQHGFRQTTELLYEQISSNLMANRDPSILYSLESELKRRQEKISAELSAAPGLKHKIRLGKERLESELRRRDNYEPDDEDTETVHGTKKEAEARLRDVISEFERGTLVGRSRQSLDAFLAQWLETMKQRVKVRTHEDYTGLWTRYIKDKFGKLPIDKITPMGIQKVYNDLSAQGLSGLTVRRLHTVLNQALRQAVQWRMLAHNPAGDVQLPRQKGRRSVECMDLLQAQTFYKTTYIHRLGAVLRFSLESGMRPQEYCALEWPDIQGNLVRVTKAITWPKGGGYSIETPKTEAGTRTVVLSPTAVEDLRKHRVAQLEHRLFMGPEWKGDRDWVFTNMYGNPISLVILNKAYKEVLKAAGLPSTFSPYTSRHSQATLCLLSGVAPKVTSEKLGHSTIQLTLDTYTSVLPTMQQEAALKVEGFLHLGHQSDTKDTKRKRTRQK